MECQQGIYGASQDNGYNARITRLEETVAQLQGQVAGLTANRAIGAEIKGLADAQQATQHLYAPLRSDVRALTELAVFVRHVAHMPPPPDLVSKAKALASLIESAQALLKDLT